MLGWPQRLRATGNVYCELCYTCGATELRKPVGLAAGVPPARNVSHAQGGGAPATQLAWHERRATLLSTLSNASANS